MNLLTQLKEYKMKRFFSNNCAWTKECKKEYAALMYLINNLSKKDVIHNEIHNSNIGMRFQEEMFAGSDWMEEEENQLWGL